MRRKTRRLGQFRTHEFFGVVRQSENEIERKVIKPARYALRRAARRVRGMYAPYGAQIVVRKALHPHAYPVYARIRKRRKHVVHRALRVDLCADLGRQIVCETFSYLAEQPLYLPRRKQRRSAAPEINGVDRRVFKTSSGELDLAF